MRMGFKKREKRISNSDLEMPWTLISMKNILRQQSLPGLHSGHDVPFMLICVFAGIMPSLSWDSAFLCVDFFKSSSFEVFRLQLCLSA